MYKAEIDAINEDGCTPLFFATQSNNKFAACVLIEQGANVRQKNTQGINSFLVFYMTLFYLTSIAIHVFVL